MRVYTPEAAIEAGFRATRIGVLEYSIMDVEMTGAMRAVRLHASVSDALAAYVERGCDAQRGLWFPGWLVDAYDVRLGFPAPPPCAAPHEVFFGLPCALLAETYVLGGWDALCAVLAVEAKVP